MYLLWREDSRQFVKLVARLKHIEVGLGEDEVCSVTQINREVGKRKKQLTILIHVLTSLPWKANGTAR